LLLATGSRILLLDAATQHYSIVETQCSTCMLLDLIVDLLLAMLLVHLLAIGNRMQATGSLHISRNWLIPANPSTASTNAPFNPRQAVPAVPGTVLGSAAAELVAWVQSAVAFAAHVAV
jgi:hypothetical protein